MKITHSRTLLIACFAYLCLCSGLMAQNDSIPAADTTTVAVAKDYSKRLLELEKQRLVDSIQKATLEAQILNLSASDDGKRDQLKVELEALRSKEVARLVEKKSQIEALKKTTIGYRVTGFFEDSLFSIYTKLGSFSAKDRAEAISARIISLSEKIGFTSDSLKIVPSESTADVVYGELILVSVSESDALWNQASKEELAAVYKKSISDAIENYQEETTIWTIAKKVGLAILVVLLILLLIRYVSKLFRWLAIKLKKQEGKRISGIKLKNYTFLDASRQLSAMLFLTNILKWVTIVFAIYIALPILFGIFPWTESFAGVLFGYIFDPVINIFGAFWKYLPKLITIVVIIVIFRYVLKAIRFLKTEIQIGKLTIPGFYPDWATPTYQIIRIIAIAFMFVVIFPYLPGSDSPIFKGVSVFLGFLFTFGSAGSLSNIIAGLVLTYMRLFTIGDRVKIGDVMGDVIEKSTLVTRVRTIKNEIISIPNSTVMNSHTINYSSDALEKGLIIHSTVTIGYDIPWKDMHETLIEAAVRTELVLKEPEPFVLQTSLDDFYVSYQINAYIQEPNKQSTIYSNLHQNIQDVCFERGIEILSPHYRAARDGNTSTIPASYLPKDYKAPSFHIFSKKEKS